MEESQKQYFREKERLAVFLMLVSTILVFGYYLFRVGFENPLLVPAKVLLLSYIVVALPLVLSAYLYKKWHIVNVFSSDASLSIACLSLLLLAGQGGFTDYLVMLSGLITGVWGIRYAIENRKEYRTKRYLWGMVAFAISLVGLFWGSDYQSPIFFERIVVEGGKLDTLFHAAIANMLMTYDVPSSGLNGAVALPYHYGSHWVLGEMAELLKIDVLTAYQLIYPVVFCVFFLGRMISFTMDVLHTKGQRVEFMSGGAEKRFYVVAIAALYGVLPKSILDKSAANWFSLFTSESYCFAIGVALLFASLLVRQDEEEKKTILTKALFGGGLAVIMFVIGLMKISVMCIVLVGVAYLFIRLKYYQDFFAWLISVALLWGALYALQLTFGHSAQPSGRSIVQLEWFDFLKNYLKPFAIWNIMLHFLLHYIWAITFIVLRLRQEKATSIRAACEVIKANKVIDAECMAIIGVVCAIPGIIIKIAGGSAYYFSDVQNWLAVPLLLALLARKGSIEVDLKENLNSKRSWKLEWSLAVIALFALGNAYSFMADALHNNWQIRYALIYDSEVPAKVAMLKYNELKEELKTKQKQRAWSEFWDRLKSNDVDATLIARTCLFPEEVLVQNRKYQLADKLRRLNNLSKEEKQRTLLYIPKSNETYWLHLAKKAPMAAPALSGIAMLNGLPNELVGVSIYGYDYYGGAENSVDKPPDDLAEKAFKLGYEKIIKIDDI